MLKIWWLLLRVWKSLIVKSVAFRVAKTTVCGEEGRRVFNEKRIMVKKDSLWLVGLANVL